jgi:hypothetical protein
MGYWIEGSIGYLCTYPAYQVYNKKALWDWREYGILELWVRRALTVDGYIGSLAMWYSFKYIVGKVIKIKMEKVWLVS